MALDMAAWTINALNVEFHLDATIAAAREALPPPMFISGDFLKYWKGV